MFDAFLELSLGFEGIFEGILLELFFIFSADGCGMDDFKSFKDLAKKIFLRGD